MEMGGKGGSRARGKDAKEEGKLEDQRKGWREEKGGNEGESRGRKCSGVIVEM